MTRSLRGLIVLLLVAACTQSVPLPSPSGSPEPNGSPGGTPLAGPTGPASPAPSPTGSVPQTLPPLPSSADLAALPDPLPVGDGAPQVEAEALLSALAAAETPEARLPLVLTALLMAGIPVLDETGEPVPFEPPPSGPALEAWQVHVIAAADPDRHSGMSASGMAELFIEDPSDEVVAEFRAALSLDLRTAAFGVERDDQLWAWLVTGRDPRGAVLTMAASETEDLVFDAFQLQLILGRLAGDAWRASEARGLGVQSAAFVPRPLDERRLFGAPLPCSYTPTEDTVVTVAEETGSRAMSKVFEFLSNKGVGGVGALGTVGLFADIAKFLAPYLLLTIDFELSDSPLIRTKSTTQDGERRQLAATLRFDTGNAQLVNCMRLVFASLGFTFSLPADGPLGNGSVSWERGYGNHGFDRVQFYGDPVHAKSDEKGIAIIGIEGRRQKVEVAPTAGRVNTTATTLLTYRIKELSLGGDLWDAIGVLESGANSGPLAAILKLALEAISRAKWSSAAYTFPVVDWGERWQAEIVIEEKSPTGSMYFSWSGVLGVDSEGLIVGDGAGEVTIIGKLCVDIPPDGHSQAVDWRIDGQHTFAFDGYKEDGVLHMLLPNLSQQFRQTGDPGPCSFDAAFKQASAQATLAAMGSAPIQLRAEPGTQVIPFGEQTSVTIRLEPVSD